MRVFVSHVLVPYNLLTYLLTYYAARINLRVLRSDVRLRIFG